jgi:pumilio RNA-binding family
LEALDDSDVEKLLCEFHHNVLSCIHDQNGNHVIQKCIEVMSAKATKAQLNGNESESKFFEGQIDFIIDDVLNNVRSLACHPYGCRVLQRILEHCPEPKKSRALDQIKNHHKALLDDQFGNYVIQHVLQYGRSTDRDSLLDIIVASSLLILARQKFASNVLEKLLKYGNSDQRSRVVEEMLKVRIDPGQARQ